MSDQTTSASGTRVRKTLRFHQDTIQQVKYWSTRRDLDENDYMVLAVEEKIARENGDYDLPSLEINRLNQIIDELKANSANLASLESVMTASFASLLGMTRGDSYLMDADDGELGAPDAVATATVE